MTCQRLASILDAYLDGEVDAPTARDIDWHLTECPHCHKQLSSRRQLQQAVRTHLPYHRAPLSLHQSLTAESTPAHATQFWRRAALALAACLAISLGALTLSVVTRPKIAPESTAPVAELVASIHLRSLQGFDDQSPVPGSASHLLDVVSSDQHTVKPWFAGRLPFAPIVQDLAPAGFPLLGGRTEMILDHPAAALVFRKSKHIINLLMWPAASDAQLNAQSQTTSDGFHALYWTKSGMTFWAISDMEFPELENFVQAWNSFPTSAPAQHPE